MRILLVEDQSRVASFLVKGLRAHGFTVESVGTGAEGIAWAQAAAWGTNLDLLILDLGLPDLDGLEVLRTLREGGVQIPVIVLTARDALDDRVQGLDMGADDYITKPFAFEELLARIRARLRPRDGQPSTLLEAGSVQLDLLTRDVRVGERAVALTAREFVLMEVFLRHPRQVLSREQLLSRVWGLDFDPDSNLVDVYVGYLRRKLGPGCIETVRGAGYRLAGDVVEHSAHPG